MNHEDDFIEGLMWNKSLYHCAEIVRYDDNRILGLQV